MHGVPLPAELLTNLLMRPGDSWNFRAASVPVLPAAKNSVSLRSRLLNFWVNSAKSIRKPARSTGDVWR